MRYVLDEVQADIVRRMIEMVEDLPANVEEMLGCTVADLLDIKAALVLDEEE